MDESNQSANAIANTLPPGDKAAELAKVTASASQHYAQKKYEAAAELYSRATALQVEMNGEMDPQNADLLYAYGKCLFQLGVNKSDVLGNKVAGDGKEQQDKETSKKRKRAPAPQNNQDEVTEHVVEKAVESKDGIKPSPAETGKEGNKPFFQISGDADDWSDASDVEEDDDAPDDVEEEDDLATAYEILDLARVLFEKQVEQQSAEGQDGRKPKETLADVHDLQAEISLENERFHDAISDSRASLVLKEQLYPREKGIVAEAHYKLSLALEFASVTVQQEDGNQKASDANSQVDEDLRNEAAEEMRSAIDCTKLRLSKLTEAVASGKEGAGSETDIQEIKEIISDMEQRLEDLKNPAISVNNPMGPAGAAADENPLGGILGSILGETPAAQKARIEEAAKGATDLSGLVRRKQPKKDEGAASSSSAGKRKAGENDDERGKRAKTEEN